MNETEFEFGLGDRVCVGTQSGIVAGQATFSFEPDSYQLLMTDEKGLPELRWFPDYMLEKQRMH